MIPIKFPIPSGKQKELIKINKRKWYASLNDFNKFIDETVSRVYETLNRISEERYSMVSKFYSFSKEGEEPFMFVDGCGRFNDSISRNLAKTLILNDLIIVKDSVGEILPCYLNIEFYINGFKSVEEKDIEIPSPKTLN